MNERAASNFETLADTNRIRTIANLYDAPGRGGVEVNVGAGRPALFGLISATPQSLPDVYLT